MIFLASLIAPSILALARLTDTRRNDRFKIFLFYSIPTLSLWFVAHNFTPKAQFILFLFHLLWTPLIFQDMERMLVKVFTLYTATGVSILTVILFSNNGLVLLLGAVILSICFGLLHLLYRRIRGVAPFGLGDYPVILGLSATLDINLFGPWIFLASVLGLTQAFVQKKSITSRIPMIPLLFMSWQFVVGFSDFIRLI